MSTGVGIATFSGVTASSASAVPLILSPASIVAQAARAASNSSAFRPIPALPAVPMGQPPAVYNFLTAIRNAAQVQYGQTKNELDRAVTVRDLTTSGGGFTLAAGNLTPGTTITNPPPDPPNVGVGVLPDITGVEFVVTALGVVITWDQVFGLNNGAIAFAEIWRVEVAAWKPDPDEDVWFYPQLEIASDSEGVPYVSFTSPSNALDENEVLIPNTLEVSRRAAAMGGGSIYGDPLDPGKEYVYFIRYAGYSTATSGGWVYSAWHSRFGTLVAALLDWQAILDTLSATIGLLHLDSVLLAKIELIDYQAGVLATQATALAQEGIDRAAGIAAATAANAVVLAAEVSERQDRVNDVWDYVGTNWAANSIIMESRQSTTDATIYSLETAMNTADGALATQIQAIIAASGEWYVQPAAPVISSGWTGTVHWLDSDDQNKHYVSTPATRSASEGWVDITDTRIIANVAAIVTEQQARIAADAAAATVSQNLASQVNNSTTGLTAIANNLSGFMTLVLDEGSNGFLAQSLKFTNLQNQVNNVSAGVAGLVTADQALSTYMSNTGEDGYIQQTLFGTTLGSELLSNLAGTTETLATVGAVDTLETYVNNQTETGLLASSSKFTALDAAVNHTDTGLAATAGAVSDLTAYVDNQNDGGFLSGASRFTNLETSYTNLTAADGPIAVNNQALQTLDTFVKSTEADGLLATNTLFTSLKTVFETAEGELADAVLAASTLTTHLEDDGPDGYLATTLSGTELLSDLVDEVTGHLATSSAVEGLTTYVNDPEEDGLLATNQKFIDLESIVINESTGVAATSSALSNLQTAVDATTYPNEIVSSASEFTTLKTAVNHADTGLSATADAHNSLDTMVRADTYGNTLLSQSSEFTELQTQLVGTDGTGGTANAVTELKSYVEGTGAGTLSDDLTKDDGIIASSSLYTNLNAAVTDPVTGLATKVSFTNLNTAVATERDARVEAISQLFLEGGDGSGAITTAFNEAGSSLQLNENGDIQGKQWAKTDINGKVVGWEFYNGRGELESTSAFNIMTDTFSIINPVTLSTPIYFGDIATPYGNVKLLVLDLDVIVLNGLIPEANFGTIGVGKITGFDSAFVTSTIGEGNITNAHIGNTISSVNYVAGQSGWAIYKNYFGFGGYAEFQNVRARGDIQASSLNVTGNARVNTLQIQDEAVVVTRFKDGVADQQLGAGNNPSWMVNSYGINPLSGRIHYTAGCTVDSGQYESGSQHLTIIIYWQYYNIYNQLIGPMELKRTKINLYVNGSTQVNYDFPFQVSGVTGAVTSHASRDVSVWAKAQGNATFRDAWATISTAKR